MKEFELHVKFQRPIDGADYDHFMDEFIDFVESRGMMIGGMGGQLPLIETTGMVLADQGSPSDEDQKILIEWLLATRWKMQPLSCKWRLISSLVARH